jgi:hypothetical protein
LEPGWNLISLPSPQSDNSPEAVLQSIEGSYDAVQWFDIKDVINQWKHNHVSKPIEQNDLINLNHTMGFWLHVTDPVQATLVVIGEIMQLNQSIPIYPGWNLVGYPSLMNRTSVDALNNIDFGNEVDTIWTFNATTQKFKEIGPSDNIEIGRGYWVHSKVARIWDVPL